MKKAVIIILLSIFLIACKSSDIQQIASRITGKAILEQPEPEAFTGQTHELSFGKLFKKSEFSQEGKVTQIRFDRTYVPMKKGDKIIIRNRDAGEETIQIVKLAKSKQDYQLVFERKLDDGEEFAFIFKYDGNYQIVCKLRGCIARVELG